MKAIRLWSVRNAGRLKKCYAVMEGTLGQTGMAFAAVEGAVKGFLFDSQSCGQRTLGDTSAAYRMEDRIGEIVTRSNALGDREPWRPAP